MTSFIETDRVKSLSSPGGVFQRCWIPLQSLCIYRSVTALLDIEPTIRRLRLTAIRRMAEAQRLAPSNLYTQGAYASLSNRFTSVTPVTIWDRFKDAHLKNAVGGAYNRTFNPSHPRIANKKRRTHAPYRHLNFDWPAGHGIHRQGNRRT